ncbi:hypothetical protein TWF506_005703 [Arthrobotrys conoides]|uniref:Uncharacterized protein n=1 Tax=Arthrobotrys conoides TaxID=74498 RepID=A0AAN8P7C3_9PEZI
MTFLAVIFAVQTTCGAPVPTPNEDAVATSNIGTSLSPRKSSLPSDLQEFIDKVPVEELNDIAMSYLGDKEVLEFINYILTGNQAKTLVVGIEAIPAFVDLLGLFSSSKGNVKIYDLINQLNEALGLEPLIPPT